MNFSAMSGSGARRCQKKGWRPGWLAGILAAGGVLAGSQAAPPMSDVVQCDYHPDNVYAYPARLALDLRRVAVMPLAAEGGGDQADGCAALAPILWEELIKTKKFEAVSVDAATLRRGTGQVNWTGTETLPADFLGFMRREYGCDGVLFAELTVYRAYAPLAIGWRFKLVDARSGQIVWASDELFDAARPAVSRAAQHFGEPWYGGLFGHGENWMAMNSPRQFGRYCAATLLKTLPER